MSESSYIVYILQCADNSFYIGLTNDLWKRLRMHNGEIPGGAKYTRGKRPVILRYYETKMTHEQAAKREYELKQLSRKKKRLICDAFTCVIPHYKI